MREMSWYEDATSELFCHLNSSKPRVHMADVANVNDVPAPAPRRRPGAPRKIPDPEPGVAMTSAQKKAAYKREWARQHYAANPVDVYNHTYDLYKKRMAKYKEAMHVVAQIRATVAV